MTTIQQFFKLIHEIRPQHKYWELQNFGEQSPERPALGMVEEIGEFAHALLKGQQGIRGTSESHREKLVDAWADTMIYTISLMNKSDPVLESRIMVHYEANKNRRISFGATVENIGRILFNVEEGLMVDEWLALHIVLMYRLAEKHEIDPIEALRQTWEKEVVKRDWKGNPESGVVTRYYNSHFGQSIWKFQSDGQVFRKLSKLDEWRRSTVTSHEELLACEEITAEEAGDTAETTSEPPPWSSEHERMVGRTIRQPFDNRTAAPPMTVAQALNKLEIKF